MLMADDDPFPYIFSYSWILLLTSNNCFYIDVTGHSFAPLIISIVLLHIYSDSKKEAPKEKELLLQFVHKW